MFAYKVGNLEILGLVPRCVVTLLGVMYPKLVISHPYREKENSEVIPITRRANRDILHMLVSGIVTMVGLISYYVLQVFLTIIYVWILLTT